jgi:hypothetical protein
MMRWKAACGIGARTARQHAALFVEKAASEEAPRSAVVQIEAAVGAEILARKELAVSARHEARELLVVQFVELFGADRLADPESSCFHCVVE